MSRAYRIQIRESTERTLRAADSVSTQLPILELLPREQMAGLLAQELEQRGYQRDGATLVRQGDGISIRVDPLTGTVEVRAEACQDVTLETVQEGRAYDDIGSSGEQTREKLRQQAQSDLDRRSSEKTARLQNQVTDRLEGTLVDLRQELNGAVNGATVEALKIKAAQMGQIKEMVEDKAAGSLTLVVEV